MAGVGLDPRRDRVPEDAARAGPAGRRARAGRPSSSCATCTSACARRTRSRLPADAAAGSAPSNIAAHGLVTRYAPHGSPLPRPRLVAVVALLGLRSSRRRRPTRAKRGRPQRDRASRSCRPKRATSCMLIRAGGPVSPTSATASRSATASACSLRSAAATITSTRCDTRARRIAARAASSAVVRGARRTYAITPTITTHRFEGSANEASRPHSTG